MADTVSESVSLDIVAGSMSPNRSRFALAVLVFLLTLLVLGAASGRSDRPRENRRVTKLVSNAAFLSKITSTEWKEPSAMAIAGETGYAVDPITDALYKVDLNKGSVVKLALNGLADPMAVEAANGRLYIADSGNARVLVVDGDSAKSLPIPPAREKARPIGLYLAGDTIAVADAANHRLLLMTLDGKVLKSIGTGVRDGSKNGFNVPGGIDGDKDGNIYAVDILNGRVQEFTAAGGYLKTFGASGDEAGLLARPKDVAVDDTGNVYVSDGLQSAVSVFSPAGRFIGFIGRENPDDEESGSLFKAVSGLTIAGDRLYAVDRFNGILTFRLP
ncbi:MAG: NHL repeat-containing protein [Candidatus Aquicultorales bacterium]